MADEVLVSKNDDGVAVVTLNRPEVLNALSPELIVALNDAFIDICRDDSVGAVVLTGAGDRAFCAGVDLKRLSTDQGFLDTVRTGDGKNSPITAMSECGKPVIGAVNGVAAAGGFELSVACDLLIASTTARFADTHAVVGVLPTWGLSQRLQRLIGPARAKEMALSGRYIDAQTAYDWGLVTRLTAPDRLMPEVLDLAGRMASLDTPFLGAYKGLMEAGGSMGLKDALAYELEFSTKYNASLTKESIASRLDGIMAKGRAQK